jgi:hypothetical protein
MAQQTGTLNQFVGIPLAVPQARLGRRRSISALNRPVWRLKELGFWGKRFGTGASPESHFDFSGGFLLPRKQPEHEPWKNVNFSGCRPNKADVILNPFFPCPLRRKFFHCAA